MHLESGWTSVGFCTYGEPNVAVLEIHASAQEEMVHGPIQDVESVVVLVHRPEEWLLRYSHDQRMEQIGPKAKAIVVLGQCFVGELQKAFPKLIVQSIPHGFFSFEVQETVLPVIGSVTT